MLLTLDQKVPGSNPAGGGRGGRAGGVGWGGVGKWGGGGSSEFNSCLYGASLHKPFIISI